MQIISVQGTTVIFQRDNGTRGEMEETAEMLHNARINAGLAYWRSTGNMNSSVFKDVLNIAERDQIAAADRARKK